MNGKTVIEGKLNSPDVFKLVLDEHLNLVSFENIAKDKKPVTVIGINGLGQKFETKGFRFKFTEFWYFCRTK